MANPEVLEAFVAYAASRSAAPEGGNTDEGGNTEVRERARERQVHQPAKEQTT
jgi:hypothetical protein